MKLRSAIALLLVALVLAPAGAEAARQQKYVYLLAKLDLGKGVPAEISEQVKKNLGAIIERNDRLSAEIPQGAPDYRSEPKKFKQYMKERDLSAYKVNVEVTEYEMEIEKAPKGRGKMLKVHVALRMFGETVPDRSMAFTGDGRATVKLGTGSTVRKRDEEVANRDAISLAVEDAVATSIRKLDAGPKKKKKKR